VYLFYRSARLGGGDLREQLAWATKITEKVNQVSETPVTLWTTVFSPGVNTLIWSTAIEHLSTLESNFDKLLADGGYLDLVAEAAKWATPQGADDGVMQYLTAPGDAAAAPAYSTAVTATLAPGSFTRGVEVGLELASRAQKATGIATQFALGVTGVYGQVSWLAGYESIEQMEAGQQALNGDATFAAYLDAEAKSCYLPGTATQTICRRIA
jgi:hypothetical protein